MADRRAPDDVYAALDAQFSKDEQVKLTMLIVSINGWNRLAVGFGVYEPSWGWEGKQPQQTEKTAELETTTV